MDYIKEFDGLLLDGSKSDGELLSIARDYIAELQAKVRDFKKGTIPHTIGRQWASYCEYVSRWADDHASMESYGMSPACFDEWVDNEEKEN